MARNIQAMYALSNLYILNHSDIRLKSIKQLSYFMREENFII